MERRLTRDNAIGLIRSNLARIRTYGVKRVALFGSVAREEARADSDVDILVEFEKGKKTFDNYMDLKFFLESLFGMKVDLVVTETIKPDLKRSIMDGAIYAA